MHVTESSNSQAVAQWAYGRLVLQDALAVLGSIARGAVCFGLIPLCTMLWAVNGRFCPGVVNAGAISLLHGALGPQFLSYSYASR